MADDAFSRISHKHNQTESGIFELCMCSVFPKHYLATSICMFSNYKTCSMAYFLFFEVLFKINRMQQNITKGGAMKMLSYKRWS